MRLSNRTLALLAVSALGVSLATAADEAPRLARGTADAFFPVQQPEPPPATGPAKPSGHAALISKVTPAVVSVFPARLMKESPEDDPLGRFFNRSKEDAAKERERTQGLGSGVILSKDGWIVTNSHVVHLANGRVADAISVELSDRRRFPARVAGVDRPTDLALLKIEAGDLPWIPLGNSDDAQIGDLVFAIGNPFKVGMTATMGMVSAKQRTIGINGPGGFEDFIQTDAAINPGNSGGALVDANGCLVGINSAIYSGSGGNVGIGFAIPTNLMKKVIVRLAEDGEVARGFFGLQLEEVDGDVAKAAKLERIQGAKVSDIMAEGPAAKAGLQAGDVILRAGDRAIETRAMLRLAFSLVKPGDRIALECSRAGERKTFEVTAIANPEARDGSVFELASLPGVKLRVGEKALFIASVSGEIAKKAQLEAGMEILEINGESATTASAAESALRRGVNKIKTRSNDEERTLAVRIE